MAALAAVMTARDTGAIATIQLFGDSAEDALRRIFRPARAPAWRPGRILVGRIVDVTRTIDQVTVGCEQPGSFCIHCHGNPLIVERIMELLQGCGVTPVSAEQLLTQVMISRDPSNTVAAEARLALTTVRTLLGAKILMHQTQGGLSRKAQDWLAARFPLITLARIL